VLHRFPPLEPPPPKLAFDFRSIPVNERQLRSALQLAFDFRSIPVNERQLRAAAAAERSGWTATAVRR
jgi:hypothetical protein